MNEVYFERMKFISDDNEMKRDTFVEDVIQTGEEKNDGAYSTDSEKWK